MAAPDTPQLGAGWDRDESRGRRLIAGGVVAVCLHLLVLFGIRIESAMPSPGTAGTAIEVSLVAAAAPAEQPVSVPPVPVLPVPPRVAKPPPEKSIPRPRTPERPAVARTEEVVAAPTPSALPVAEALAPPIGSPGHAPPAGAAGQAVPIEHAARGPGSEGLVSARPRYKSNPKPRYPLTARRRRQEGVVLLSVSVSASGEPVAIEIETSSGLTALDEAAADAVRRWEFEPGVLDGEAVPSRVEVPIRFELD